MLRLQGKISEIYNKFISLAKTLNRDKVYVLEIRECEKSRTLDQNNLYWKLLSDYAKWGQENIDVLHNQMLNSYGVPTDEIAIIRADKNIEKLSDIHYKRTSKKVMGKNGNLYQYYIKMKGSHEMTTKEMAFLINGLINEIIGSGADRDIDISGVDR